MPVVDLDDELSIVDEGVEDMLQDKMEDANSIGAKSEISAMTGDLSPMQSPGANSEDEREQQWIIDSILQHKGDSSPTSGKGSETDDSSLYLQDMDASPKEAKQSTPKTKNKKEAKKAPSPSDMDYHNYMDVSSILDNFEEEEDQGGWRDKVASSLKNKKPLDKTKKSAKTEEVSKSTSTTQPKEGWRNKNLFRGSKAAKKNPSQEKAREQTLASDPHETNLAPLGNVDHVDSMKDGKQSEGWMPKMSFLGNSKAQKETSEVDDFEEHYASNMAPRGNEDDLEANLDAIATSKEETPEVQGSWSSKVTSFISTVTESKPEPEVTDKADDQGLAETTDLTTDLVSSIESDTKTMIENEAIDEEKCETKQPSTNPFADDDDDDDEEKGEVKTGVNPFDDDADEMEGSFVANETPEDDGMVTAWVGNTNEAEVQGSDDQANNTWKSKVKSVRKSSSNKLSSIRKKSSKSLAKKSFTEDKMKQLETTTDDKTVETRKTIDTSNTVTKGPSQVPGRRKRIAIVLGVGVLFILFIVGVSIGASKRASSGNGTPAPPQVPNVPVEELEDLYRLVFPISGDDLLVEDPNSPLVKAFIWTANDKAMRPDDSDDETILRYVSAVTYYSLGGESWTNQNNFLSQEDLCDWNDAQQSGIICENGEEIKELQLSRNNLSGGIPDEIMYLSSLKIVNMGDNGVTGGLPGTIGQMNRLQGLNLSSNLMTGELPSSLFASKRLGDIMLDDNDFSGTINPTLGDMSTLERFTVSKNSFSGPVPPTIGSSSVLKVVDLSANDLTGTIPGFNTDSPIEILHLNRNNIAGTIPGKIGNLQNLASLRLRMNNLTGTIPRTLGNCLGLRDILLDNNFLEGPIPEKIAELPELESLLVSENKDITGGAGPFCEREDTLDMFGVNTCGEETVDCPCCNICCQSDPEYGCFEFAA